MAFDSVPGLKVYSSINNQYYVLGDYFSVYTTDGNPPIIYKWEDITSAAESKDGLAVYTDDGHNYTMLKTNFNNPKEYLAARAILEGSLSQDAIRNYRPLKRILPFKYEYGHISQPKVLYVAQGVYSEKEINTCNLALVSTKIGKFMWLSVIFLTLITFGIIFLIAGLDSVIENWLYFLPISVFCGIIVSILVYIITALLTRYRYSEIFHQDPALQQQISFILANEGFAAIEDFLYTGCDLIPWSKSLYYIETKGSIAVILDKSIFWLPKRMFPKELQKEIVNFITARVKQK